MVKRDQTLGSLQREFARAASALEGRKVEDISLSAWLRDDRGVTAGLRLAVYSHAYFERIHSALREDFGALAAALGDAAFHDLAKLYLMAYPPHSFSLRFAGEALPRFLCEPVAELFQRRWPFAADLAALEWTIADLFDAPDSPVLARESLARVPPDHWGSLRFRAVPAHRLLTLAWPVSESYEAWAPPEGRTGTLPVLRAAKTRVLVHRRRERVFQRALTPLEARAWEIVCEGRDLESLCSAIADEGGEDRAVEQAVEFLERWLADELLADFAS